MTDFYVFIACNILIHKTVCISDLKFWRTHSFWHRQAKTTLGVLSEAYIALVQIQRKIFCQIKVYKCLIHAIQSNKIPSFILFHMRLKFVIGGHSVVMLKPPLKFYSYRGNTCPKYLTKLNDHLGALVRSYNRTLWNLWFQLLILDLIW